MQESMRTEELVKALRDSGRGAEAAADRLEAILKAWEAYWLELDAPVRDATMIRVRRLELRRAILAEKE